VIQKNENDKNLDKIFVIKYTPKFQELSLKFGIRVPDNVLHYLNFIKIDGKNDINIFI
jgi:hypothetical protein